MIGLACAWRMAQAGAKVAVFERGVVGREASWAAAGMLAPQCEAAHHPPEADSDGMAGRAAMFDLCLQSRALYPAFADELFDTTGIDIELSLRGHARGDWRQPGILYVETRDDDRAIAAFEAQRGQGQRVEATPDYPGTHAVWLPDEGQVHNRKLLKALRLAVLQAGVKISQYSAKRVSRLFDTRWCEDRINIDVALGVQCDKVLVCAGAWSHGIGNLPPHCQIPVRPIAGQMMAVRAFARSQRRFIPHIIYGSDVYLVPRRDGQVLIGATMEDSGFHKKVTVRGTTSLLRAARSLVPEIEEFVIEDQWAGLRPASEDGLPILGSTPLENLFVATGHFRNGILLTPITAQLMADCVLNGVEAPAAFGISRFAVGVA